MTWREALSLPFLLLGLAVLIPAIVLIGLASLISAKDMSINWKSWEHI